MTGREIAAHYESLSEEDADKFAKFLSPDDRQRFFQFVYGQYATGELKREDPEEQAEIEEWLRLGATPEEAVTTALFSMCGTPRMKLAAELEERGQTA